MAKYGKKSNMVPLAVLAIVAILGIGMFTGAIQFNIGGDGGGGGDTDDGDTSAYGDCPDDGDSSVSLSVLNRANTTGSEYITETFYVLTPDGQRLTSITDTDSAPTAVTLNCGEKVILKPISTSGAAGDSSFVYSLSASGGEVKLVDGNIELTPTKGSTRITALSEQHSVGVVRVYDNIQKALMYDSGDASATDFEGDATTFTSTTNNATASDETLGLDYTITYKAYETDTNCNDRGIIILVEAPVAVWDEPVVYVDGVKLDEATTSLTDDERKAYTDYEYAFLIPKDKMVRDGAEGIEIDFAMDLLSGVASASADVQVDLAVRGQALTTDGMGVLSNTAVTDASTPAQIHDLFDITFDIT